MEKNQLRLIIQLSEDIDIFAKKVLNESSIERCKPHLVKCIDCCMTIENVLMHTSELTEDKHIINDILEDLRIANNSKSINEIYTRMSSCIYSNSIIYANFIDLHEEL